MNKRGDTTFNAIIMIPRIMFLMLVIFAVVLLIRSYVVYQVDVSDVQAEMLVDRLLYSSYGLTFFDKKLSIIHPLVVDPSRCDTSSLAEVITPKGIASEVKIIKGDDIIKKCYVNEKWYRNWFARTTRSIQGPGGVKRFDMKRGIIIKNAGGEYAGRAEFTILVPNS